MITVLRGDPHGRLAVMLPGSASSGDFVARAFGPALAARGLSLATADWQPHRPGPVAHAEAELEAFVRSRHPVLVGGVSLGAHVVARLAARIGPDLSSAGVQGLVLALPAWTGQPDEVAALSQAAARAVERVGVDTALREIRPGALPWVHRELEQAWIRYSSDQLVGLLDATASSEAPSLAELAAVSVPTGLLAFSDDPFHPLAVARAWTGTIPSAFLSVTTLAQAGRNVRGMGDLALAAWQAAVSLRRSGSSGRTQEGQTQEERTPG